MSNPGQYPNSPPRGNGGEQRPPAPPALSIPMQNLARPPDEGHGAWQEPQHYGGGASSGGSQARSPPTEAQMAANLPGISTYWEHSYHGQQQQDEGGVSPVSPTDAAALQFALPPDINQQPAGPLPVAMPSTGMPTIHEPYDMHAPYYDDPVLGHDGGDPHHHHHHHHHLHDGGAGEYSESLVEDRVPLAAAAQPIAGATLSTPQHEAQPRDSFQTVHDLENSPGRTRDRGMLGFDLEPGFGNPNRQGNYGASLSPDGPTRRNRSPSTSGALQKAGSIVRAMSQRVVMISGESETMQQQEERRRRRSRSPNRPDNLEGIGGGMDGMGGLGMLGGGGMGAGPRRYPSQERAGQGGGGGGGMPMLVDTSYQSQLYSTPMEKSGAGPEYVMADPMGRPDQPPPRRGPMPNPLKGNSLGIFSPENPFRKWLCNILVLPFTEPLILGLIVTQTVLLAIEAAPNVFKPGNQRPARWAGTPIDWAMLGLFIVFSFELLARIVVSGFILNAAEYSSIDRQRGIKGAVADQYKAIFQPQRFKSVRGKKEDNVGPSAFARSFTIMQGHPLPETLEEQQRYQLARRAFLRHGFNRLDFVAVVAFWIAFVLSITGIEHDRHMYVFRFLSCLRILRLLALTSGTSIILRSLKKAFPLLIRVLFLIGFFWLVFAIVGVQSFKSSLRRQCVWIDPTQPTNLSATFTNNFTFCGGFLDSDNNTKPWVFLEDDDLSKQTDGAKTGKGYICPRGSICLQQDNPYHGTVHFDNIHHSLELVFVIMSANTFSDIMYYTTNSDFLPAALFFGVGIMILMLWMINLLIAVITSSFQVIREESRTSAFAVVGGGDAAFMMPQQGGSGRRGFQALQRLYDKTSWFWVVVIAFNLLVSAFRSSYTKPDRLAFINNAEVVTTILLGIEILIRIVADFRGFHRNARNMIDLTLAIITSVILIPPIRNSGQAYAWLTVFQILRIYRLVLAIPVTRNLMKLVLGNATGIGNLMLFVFLIAFLMAIFAVQLFRGELPEFDAQGNTIEISFYSIFNAFLGMYQILSSENWTAILYDVQAYTYEYNTAWIGAMFLIGWFILSFFILVNMFIAVIQENFDVDEDVKRMLQVRAFLQKKELGSSSSNLALSSIFSFGRTRRRRDPLDYGPAMVEMLLKDTIVRDFLDETMDPLQESGGQGGDAPIEAEIRAGFANSLWGRVKNMLRSRDPNPFYSSIRFEQGNDNLDPRELARQAVNNTSMRRKAQREYLLRHPRYNISLFIFGPKNPIRRFCQRLVGPGRGSERIDGVEPNKVAWYSFSAFIYAAIVAMVVLAAVATPLYQKEYAAEHSFNFTNWFVWTDMAFTVLFTVEALIKIVADGFLWTPNAYFRSSWGIIDGVVLVTLWINIITLLAKDGAVSRAVGAFKALRALRLLNISDSARETFHSLIVVGFWKIFGAAFVSISLLIPFAIYGVNLFAGQLVICNDGGISNLTDCVGEYSNTPFRDDWALLSPRVASNPYYSFDDFGSSLFILFQIVSQEGWVDVSFSAQSITGIGLQPQPQSRPGNALFFVVFNLLATVFVLTLFISVFMRNYTEQTGVAFLTAEQRSWLELRKMLRQISPSKASYDDSEKRWKKWCHKRAIEKRGKWYIGITCVLVLHLIVLLLEFASEPDWWTRTRDFIFLGFTLIYMVNIVIRIIGLGWTRFRRSSWDLYSLLVVLGAFAASILLISRPDFETYVRIHKFILVAIVLLLIPRNDALDQLFKTAAASLTTIGNLLATWLVFFLVFAIALTQAFSLTRFGPNENNNVNFRTVPHALILLFRMSVGEGWNVIMEDFASITPPLCVEGPNFFDSDCGSTPWAWFLFIFWNILSMYIFVNLFVSLIYESFSYVYQRSSGVAALDRDEIRRFKEAWRSVDPQGTGFITKEAFPRLLGELSGVFEMRIYDAEDSVRQILEDVRQDTTASRHTSIATASQASGVDIAKLNKRLAKIDVHKVRERRRRFNIFFEEVVVSADPDKGISFTQVLMILAHYNIINDNKSLRLEEFLRRRARLQRVEEEVRRRVVLGFFNTLFWSRRFKRHMEHKRSARMTAIPQLDVPDILVDDEGDFMDPSKNRRDGGSGGGGGGGAGASGASPAASSDFLSVDDARRHNRNWSGSADLSLHDTSYAHPLSFPTGGDNNTPGSSPPGYQHRSTGSAFSFELQEPAGYQQGGAQAMEGQQFPQQQQQQQQGENDAVSPALVRDMLDNSVWAQSIRRSATVRRQQEWGSHAGSYGGSYNHF